MSDIKHARMLLDVADSDPRAIHNMLDGHKFDDIVFVFMPGKAWRNVSRLGSARLELLIRAPTIWGLRIVSSKAEVRTAWVNYSTSLN